MSWKELKSKSGLGNLPNLFEGDHNALTDCPNCGGIRTLKYNVVEQELDEATGETMTVEGLVCSECYDLFMNPDEGARFLNEQAKRNESIYRYLSHDGEIIETRIQ